MVTLTDLAQMILDAVGMCGALTQERATFLRQIQTVQAQLRAAPAPVPQADLTHMAAHMRALLTRLEAAVQRQRDTPA